MDISKYTSYFHDGDLIDIKHLGNHIEISMISAQIEPEDMIENMPPLKADRIIGKLYLEGVKNLKINDKLFSKTLEKIHDDGEILDFEILDNEVTLNVEWTDFHFSPNESNFSAIQLEAEKIYWKNVPNFSKDMSQYTAYFLNGSLIDFGHLRNKIDISKNNMAVSMRSAKIDLRNTPSLNKKIITGRLCLGWVKEIKINDKLFSNTLEKPCDSGEILHFEILDDKAILGIQWMNDAVMENKSDYSLIEIEAEIIHWENVSNFPPSKKEIQYMLEHTKIRRKLRYDGVKPKTLSHENPAYLHRYNKYLDAEGNPVPKGHPDSRLYSPK